MVWGTCYRAGKHSANCFPLLCWEASPLSPPGAALSWVPPQLSAELHFSPSCRVLAPLFICTARLMFGCLLLICSASPSHLCSLPCGDGWRIRLSLPFSRLLAAEAFPALSPLSPAASRLFVWALLLTLATWCLCFRELVRPCACKLLSSLLNGVRKGIVL